MLKARNDRKRAENDMKLLANRLAHLRVAEERARKKIAETKQRTQEIVGLKKRNMETHLGKSQLFSEKLVATSESQSKVTSVRRRTREQTRASRDAVVRQRREAAELQRLKSRELNQTSDERRSAAAERNKLKSETVRRKREELKRQKEFERAEKERKRKEAYDNQVALEAQRRDEAEALIKEMADEEAKMLSRLKETQTLQRQAYEDLQTSLQL